MVITCVAGLCKVLRWADQGTQMDILELLEEQTPRVTLDSSLIWSHFSAEEELRLYVFKLLETKSGFIFTSASHGGDAHLYCNVSP